MNHKHDNDERPELHVATLLKKTSPEVNIPTVIDFGRKCKLINEEYRRLISARTYSCYCFIPAGDFFKRFFFSVRVGLRRG